MRTRTDRKLLVTATARMVAEAEAAGLEAADFVDFTNRAFRMMAEVINDDGLPSQLELAMQSFGLYDIAKGEEQVRSMITELADLRRRGLRVEPSDPVVNIVSGEQ